MLNFLKKKIKAKISVFAPAEGKVIPITSVSDELFSTKTLGDGYAVEPIADQIYAPVTGKVTSIFPTKHAISFRSENGLEWLLHMGVDTVELKGKPFYLVIHVGQRIKAGTFLGTVNRKMIIDSGRSDEIIVICTNMDKIGTMSKIVIKNVKHGEAIGSLTLK